MTDSTDGPTFETVVVPINIKEVRKRKMLGLGPEIGSRAVHKVVIEFGESVYQTLSTEETETQLNKSTIANRAVALYGTVAQAWREDKVCLIHDPATGETHRLIFEDMTQKPTAESIE